ncbi:MAG: Methylcobalamin:coenzyme M methyltransferase MtbA [Candidatus Methanohalarchaeum thermophilum]|uniref:Methylcobalamin:coenzyme M methyltransferase MtbA n=1 Tax=Methanohalarchaeum thermophilum TaxID=1903181 RepID=A0A1Q6DWG5_METT1|nr:MAG: Methylcobalamin:coenzyme M methyltransferase MtbA [Candidatus Methanohalarchaeum thermophilum]
MKDKMTSMERWRSLVDGDPVDRVPVFPWAIGHAATTMGYETLGEYYSKPDVQLKCQKIEKELFGYDQPVCLLDPGYYGEAWGTEIEEPYREAMSAPSPTVPAASNAEELEELEVPDPEEDMPRFVELVGSAIEEDLFPIVWIQGGWVSHTAPQLVELEKFMKWTRTDPDLCEIALDKTAEFAIKLAEYFADNFGTEWIPMDATPTDANILIRAEVFGDIVKPRAKKVHEKVLDLGVPMWYTHYCSDHLKNIEAGHIEDIPLGDPGIIHFGPEITIGDIKERFGKRNIVCGNVDPPTLQTGSFDEVTELCKQNIETGRDSSNGYMLGAGCEFPPRAPASNLYAMVKAAREYGQY